MSEENEFSLPGTGYDILAQTIQGYKLASGLSSATEVAQKAGISNRTQVSANNKFLLNLGIIEKDGRKKKITPDGEELALALANSAGEEVEEAWKEVFLGTQEIRELLEMINVQQSIPKEDISGRIASSLGMMKTDKNARKISRLVDLLERAGLIQKDGDSYSLVPDSLENTDSDDSGSEEASVEKNGSSQSEESEKSTSENSRERVNFEHPSLSIAVQIYVDSSATAEQIDHVFSSMAKHLYGRDDD